MRVAFDCDGTLKSLNGELRDEVCRLLIAFLWSDADVVVWSGGGKDYAQSVFRQVVRKYDLLDLMPDRIEKVTCIMKDGSKPDLAIDDEYVTLGKVNVCYRPAGICKTCGDIGCKGC